MSFRSVLFWPHLVVGALAGIVIFLMCATGTLLTFERQLIDWSDRGYQSVVPADGASRAPLSVIVRALGARGLTPTSVSIAHDPTRPVTVAAGDRTFFADAYSGALIGEPSTTVRPIMRGLRNWHRWLGASDGNRSVGRAFTGWATVLFAFLAISGAYLWIPRSWNQLKAVSFFRGGLRGKARDFNWHNVVGAWACVPLFILAVSAWPISFPWANAAVYRAMGEPVPAGRGGGEGAGRERQRARESSGERRGPRAEGVADAATAAIDVENLERLLARAEQLEPAWMTITVRWPASASASVQFAIDRGNGGQPQARSTLTLTRTGDVATYETFGSQTPGRRLRSLLRFAHTGEVLGVAGQMLAGLTSAGGMVLVWTGLSLAWRRAASWLRRRARSAVVRAAPAADSAA